MAKKVTPADIAQFNKLYYELKTFAAVAKETGFSASTVSKYVDKTWTPVDESKKKTFTAKNVPPFNTLRFRGLRNFGELCVYSTDEKAAIEELWQEIEK